ncbi:(2Fe-2S) ferredoxin domain-containing protein [Streptomyces sp. NPDC052042]|uniref:(2Fe-2S) ferredoxin domain-containing protein n=1 Tax=Streptomyces sp. NPDC052042 TaxID=3365683 RepID=UPI0037CD7F14
MSRRTPRPAPARGASRPTVSVCRGCCCGTPKIPGVDHAGQLAELRRTLAGVAVVRAVDCLDACEQANVVVVQPSAQGRAVGGRPVWLGLVNDPDAVTDIAAWAEAGGPGLADLPGILDLYTFRPSRRVRQEQEERAERED